ncbi:MAG: competence/damage-inducible protein A [Rikenellaceae bacterium]|nr:competence/damage-inducible protein A [Rikenellaceae bacterium]
MNATLITIGDELLIGQVVDTNSCFISRKFGDCGIRVIERTSIGDDADTIIATLNRVLQQSEIVVITGGLGPTKDDLTKHTLARYFDSKLVQDLVTYRFVEQMLARRGIEFNELNQAQALVPECCTVLPNRNGTAPGMWFDTEDGKIVISLPGVPFEMEALITDEVVPRLVNRFALKSIIHRTMITFGMAESVLAATIADWEDALPKELHLAYLPNPKAIRLRLSCYDIEREKGEAMIDKAFDELKAIIPEYILGYEGASVAEEVAKILYQRGATLAVAESCTGGKIANTFTAMAGASEYFKCGVVAYANEAKQALLGVKAETLNTYGAVSQQVAEQMAEGVRRVGQSDYAIATTGIAGPTGGSDEKPVGTVWIAIATPTQTIARKMTYGQIRIQNIERATTSAINLLRLALLDKIDTATSDTIL